MQKKLLLNAVAISLPLFSMGVHAGEMGPAHSKFLLVEGGVSYMHAYYKNSIKGADSYTTIDPNGRSYNPSKLYPNNFFGGYMGVSFLTYDYLLNMRYELFQNKDKKYTNNQGDQLVARQAPAKLAFTLDKVWHANNMFMYGLGAGVVASTHNKAEIFNYQPVPPRTQIGYSYPGRVRLDPLVEAMAMYRISDRVNLKGNVSYQIPAHSYYTSGHLGVNLGVNYAIPV